MGSLQIIRTEAGEELVVLSRADYDRLAASAGDEAAEDRLTARLVDESDARIAAGGDVALPEAVWREIEDGTAAAAVLRRFRGLSRAELAAHSRLNETVLGEIEDGRRPTSAERAALAAALRVPVDVFDD